ncbi:MAG: hypothetical protein SO434_07595 [Eubacteriales bacterium]|nr:hypothetical protein [Eubacteriales bacterium]
MPLSRILEISAIFSNVTILSIRMCNRGVSRRIYYAILCRGCGSVSVTYDMYAPSRRPHSPCLARIYTVSEPTCRDSGIVSTSYENTA